MTKSDAPSEAFYNMLANYKWPDDFVCRKCGLSNYIVIKGGLIRRCKTKECKGKEESVLVNTVLQGQKISPVIAYNIIDHYYQCFLSIDMEAKVIPRDGEIKDASKSIESFYNKGSVTSIMEIAKQVSEENAKRKSIIQSNFAKMKFSVYNDSHDKISKQRIDEIAKQIKETGTSDDEVYLSWKREVIRLKDENHKLFEMSELMDNSVRKKTEKYIKSCTPSKSELAALFQVEENTIAQLLRKICSKLDESNPDLKERSYTFMDYLVYVGYSFEELMRTLMKPTLSE